jgi:hypothetical protein
MPIAGTSFLNLGPFACGLHVEFVRIVGGRIS